MSVVDLNNKLTAPKGWFTPEELEKNFITNTAERPEEIDRFIKMHLPMAARRTERLIVAIKEKFDIGVPESYLRVRADQAFQALLLVSQDDYASPRLAAAKLLAEEYGQTETYDICFTFSVLSSGVVNDNYKLKHVQQYPDSEMRLAS